MSSEPVRIGVLGLGSVFEKYGRLLAGLERERSAKVVAVYDPDAARCGTEAARFGITRRDTSAEGLIGRDDVDAVLVLTNMQSHGRLATAAYAAGKHVLVEKPMATTLDEAAELVRLSRSSDRTLVCAPHVLLSPTYRQMHDRLRAGAIGEVKLARALYGWAGPWWGRWFYQPGGGALFDLGIYNITTLAGFLGPVRRVTALVGTAIRERVVDGVLTCVEADDNAQVLLDFGHETYASVTTGFTIQKYGRAPAVELYGLGGTMNMLGDDWAPRGFEQWRNDAGCWEVFDETAPGWPWADGVNHLVDCIRTGRPSLTRPEHAFHALEVILAAVASAEQGRAVDVASDFPAPVYPDEAPRPGARSEHDHS
ncbi:MAG: Gfo/Idh/MocA family protein [Kineosporiaceae bacterium]